jgi:hypothetical protein
MVSKQRTWYLVCSTGGERVQHIIMQRGTDLSTSCPFRHAFELSVELLLRKRRRLVVASATLRRRVLAKRVVFAERAENDEVWLPRRASLGLVRVQVPAPRNTDPDQHSHNRKI